MTKKDLVKIIREVVKHEMKSVVKQELNEALNNMESMAYKSKKQKSKEVKYTKNKILNEVLNETIPSKSDEPWPEISQKDIRNRLMGTQGGIQTDINNRPVDVNNLEPSLNKALNRDYSELVKRFNKK